MLDSQCVLNAVIVILQMNVGNRKTRQQSAVTAKATTRLTTEGALISPNYKGEQAIEIILTMIKTKIAKNVPWVPVREDRVPPILVLLKTQTKNGESDLMKDLEELTNLLKRLPGFKQFISPNALNLRNK
ncbi:hypothetical protein JTB14_027257 [Gonioctena quinquepunctata]|nr:hypothetical protein JTB14_027257 [Gonioctena quinquepunctata]